MSFCVSLRQISLFFGYNQGVRFALDLHKAQRLANANTTRPLGRSPSKQPYLP